MTLRAIVGQSTAFTTSVAKELVRVRAGIKAGRLVRVPAPIGTRIYEANYHFGRVMQRIASKEDMLTKIKPGWGTRYFSTSEEAEAAIAALEKEGADGMAGD